LLFGGAGKGEQASTISETIPPTQIKRLVTLNGPFLFLETRSTVTYWEYPRSLQGGAFVAQSRAKDQRLDRSYKRKSLLRGG
jgi:hypothetical protein